LKVIDWDFLLYVNMAVAIRSLF